jgi:6-methylsalicylate decarboxylase
MIDVHHHILPERYVKQVGTIIGAQASSGRVPAWGVEHALERMSAHGVSTAITSISSPGLAVEDKGGRAALARWCNEFAARLGIDHPGRFGMFAALPLPDIDATLEEIDFAYRQCAADGVCLLSNYGGRYADDADLRPVFDELNRRRAVVFLHPTMPRDMALVGGLSASMLEFPFDTTRAIAALIFGGVLRDFPGIRFIAAHAGGAMPCLAERIDLLAGNNPRLKEFIPQGAGVELGKMYYDTALSAHRVQFSALLASASADNVLFGSDYPFGLPNQIEDAVARLAQRALPKEVLAKVHHGNALKLFPRFANARPL